ncbi:MAG: AAA family ATPase [Clostridiales bacterium]|jgi:hypothetical protein|nr:AAA family ATPase [Clostridiales bacterium]
MVIGDIRKINLTTSSFETIIKKDFMYVDKSRFIENFLDSPQDAQIIARQRRFEKA